MRLPTVAEQELQVGHVHLPAGDAVALRQGQSDAVDVLLQGPSGVGGRGEGERNTSPRAAEKAYRDCSPAGRGAASTVLTQMLHVIHSRKYCLEFDCPSLTVVHCNCLGQWLSTDGDVSFRGSLTYLQTFVIITMGEEEENAVGMPVGRGQGCC